MTDPACLLLSLGLPLAGWMLWVFDAGGRVIMLAITSPQRRETLCFFIKTCGGFAMRCCVMSFPGYILVVLV